MTACQCALSPFFLTLQVVIPSLEWADTTLSKPLLVLVIISSLTILPIFLAPSSPLIWLAGISFGYFWGYVLVIVGMSLGMSITYVIGRRLLHDRVQDWISSKPRYVALLRAANQVRVQLGSVLAGHAHSYLHRHGARNVNHIRKHLV